jgi:hypothetical protein
MAQNIIDAAAAVAAALAAQAAVGRDDLDALAAATEAVNLAVSAYSLVIAPPAPFALTPAVAVTGVVDFKSREGHKLFQTATSKLEEELFDCTPDGTYQFLKSLSARAEECGWTSDTGGFLRIPKDLSTPLSRLGDTESLLDTYGTITIEKIRRWEELYLSTETRPAQDAYMMHKCLMNSISKTGKDKVTIWAEQYTVGGLSSGNLLLKIIIRESHLDTNATTSSIRTKLASLDIYIMTIGCNITKFNGHVKLLLDQLLARGQTTNDLLVFLFKGYGAVPDMAFKNYIQRKKENHEEGDSMTPEKLMLLADSKYKLIKESGGWGIANPQEEKILALEAKLAKIAKGTKRKPPGNFNENPNKRRKTDGDNPKKAKPSFMEKAPPKSDLVNPFKPRQWNDKNWCCCCKLTGGKCNGEWRVHNPTDCQGKSHVFKNKEEPGKPKNKNDARKLKLAKAHAAVSEETESENESDEDERLDE